MLLALARCWLQLTPRAAVEALPHRRGVFCTAMSRCVLLLTDLNHLKSHESHESHLKSHVVSSLFLDVSCSPRSYSLFMAFHVECQYLGPLHLRAFLSIPADSALPATLFLNDASSQLATGTEQSSIV